MAPFRELIKPKNSFYWDTTLEEAFQKSKVHIVNLVKQGVSTFDVSKPTCIQTDWSQQGIGFLLLQKYCKCPEPLTPACCKEGWKLTFAGSRFTTEAESRYSPTEGEALAVSWSLNKSKFFTLGCKRLLIATDHQPLLGLLKKDLHEIPNPRLQRIREKTLLFQFDVVYTPAKFNKGADAISRKPVIGNVNLAEINSIEENLDDMTASVFAYVTEEDNCNTDCLDYNSYSKLKQAINVDSTYTKLQHSVSKGFPNNKEEMDPELQDFWSVRNRLVHTNDGIVLMDNRIVIPRNYRKCILNILHSAHQGVCAMKRRAVESVYWPHLNRDLKKCSYQLQVL